MSTPADACNGNEAPQDLATTPEALQNPELMDADLAAQRDDTRRKPSCERWRGMPLRVCKASQSASDANTAVNLFAMLYAFSEQTHSCRKRTSAKMTMLQPLRCAFFPIRGYALVQVLLQSRHRSLFPGSWRHCCAWGVAGDDGIGATPAYDLLIASGQLDWSSGLPTAAREVDTTASASSSIDAPAPQRLLQVQTLCLGNHVLLKLSL